MGKIKLNLVSGASLEKPLITAFAANNNKYVVLDNEINGSMGLPIILVCKLENNKLIKITDQNEWGMVKEYLKNIIAGNKVEFVQIENILPADDIYYTQLTLPVPSFDALKNTYKVENVIDNVNNINVEPNIPNMESFANVTGIGEPSSAVQNDATPIYNPVQNITPVGNTIPQMETPVIDIPINNEIINPVVNEPMVIKQEIGVVETSNINPVLDNQFPVQNVIQEQNIDVTKEVSAPSINESIFKEQKEAFMQACENMFDALVQKFEKELENK